MSQNPQEDGVPRSWCRRKCRGRGSGLVCCGSLGPIQRHDWPLTWMHQRERCQWSTLLKPRWRSPGQERATTSRTSPSSRYRLTIQIPIFRPPQQSTPPGSSLANRPVTSSALVHNGRAAAGAGPRPGRGPDRPSLPSLRTRVSHGRAADKDQRTLRARSWSSSWFMRRCRWLG